ncbi:hypothetical protein EW145_g1777 [Phellinidium pouzarii]|uniref:Uncharacterized protein n=1 Tax=Phellinidium pouzarii TaxID=167371 RepID=A0A4S4LDN5_9AGAM|nr:hypothetical protein EW145_g1777 [Phellinidium pouzarii]
MRRACWMDIEAERGGLTSFRWSFTYWLLIALDLILGGACLQLLTFTSFYSTTPAHSITPSRLLPWGCLHQPPSSPFTNTILSHATEYSSQSFLSRRTLAPSLRWRRSNGNPYNVSHPPAIVFGAGTSVLAKIYEDTIKATPRLKRFSPSPNKTAHLKVMSGVSGSKYFGDHSYMPASSRLALSTTTIVVNTSSTTVTYTCTSSTTYISPTPYHPSSPASLIVACERAETTCERAEEIAGLSTGMTMLFDTVLGTSSSEHDHVVDSEAVSNAMSIGKSDMQDIQMQLTASHLDLGAAPMDADIVLSKDSNRDVEIIVKRALVDVPVDADIPMILDANKPWILTSPLLGCLWKSWM